MTTGLELRISGDELDRLRERVKEAIERFYALDPAAAQPARELLNEVDGLIGGPLLYALPWVGGEDEKIGDGVWSDGAGEDLVQRRLDMHDMTWKYAHAVTGADRLAEMYSIAAEGSLPSPSYQANLGLRELEDTWAAVRWWRRIGEALDESAA